MTWHPMGWKLLGSFNPQNLSDLRRSASTKKLGSLVDNTKTPHPTPPPPSLHPWNTKGESITVPLTSCLTGLD
jgi:hypothetical protein